MDDIGFSKEITFQSSNSGPSTIMSSSKYKMTFRIQSSPANGMPYFMVQNFGGNYLGANSLVPAGTVTRQKLRILTHFCFGGG